jgi:hypothetical protein
LEANRDHRFFDTGVFFLCTRERAINPSNMNRPEIIQPVNGSSETLEPCSEKYSCTAFTLILDKQTSSRFSLHVTPLKEVRIEETGFDLPLDPENV